MDFSPCLFLLQIKEQLKLDPKLRSKWGKSTQPLQYKGNNTFYSSRNCQCLLEDLVHHMYTNSPWELTQCLNATIALHV